MILRKVHIRRSASALIVTLALLFSAAAPAQQRVTENTFALDAGARSPPATLAEMSWLAGRWTGTAFGGVVEEVWAEPAGGAMIGLFRLVKEGKPVFYELMAVVEHQGSLVMRLKHFHPDLKGWEEKNEVKEFPLVARRGGALLFAGMSFHPAGDELVVYLAVEHRDKPAEEMKFTYRRAAASR